MWIVAQPEIHLLVNEFLAQLMEVRNAFLTIQSGQCRRTSAECKDEWIEAMDILRNTSSEKPE